MVRFKCENDACRLYGKEYEYGSDEANPGRCLSCRLPMIKFLAVGIDPDKRQAAIDSFLAVTGEHWGTSIIETVENASHLMDDQDIPLNGRAVFQPGVGVLYDPTHEEELESVRVALKPIYDEHKTDIVGLLVEQDQIDESFLLMIRAAHSNRAFYIESRLRELHRELLAIVNIEDAD